MASNYLIDHKPSCLYYLSYSKLIYLCIVDISNPQLLMAENSLVLFANFQQ